jgi:hypothetical protein
MTFSGYSSSSTTPPSAAVTRAVRAWPSHTVHQEPTVARDPGYNPDALKTLIRELMVTNTVTLAVPASIRDAQPLAGEALRAAKKHFQPRL